MNVYRINLRFDLDNERERLAAEYLQQFPQRGKTTRNRFAVDALCAYISRIEQDDRPLLESIRQMPGAGLSYTITSRELVLQAPHPTVPTAGPLRALPLTPRLKGRIL